MEKAKPAEQSWAERQAEYKRIWEENPGLYAVYGIPIGMLIMLVMFLVTKDTDASEFASNYLPEVFGIAFTFGVLERWVSVRDQQQLKARLIRQMSSRENSLSLLAAQELRAHGWLTNGSLAGAYLRWANLSCGKGELVGADLSGTILEQVNFTSTFLRDAKLQRADLKGANLKDARLVNTRLQDADLRGAILARTFFMEADLTGAYIYWSSLKSAYMLCGSTMPDGSRYDGRLNLAGDYEQAGISAELVHLAPEIMAKFYGVSLEEYLAGQEWAERNPLNELGNRLCPHPGDTRDFWTIEVLPYDIDYE